MKTSRKHEDAPQTSILQIMTAVGWHARYVDDQGEEVRPLVGFALIEVSFRGDRAFRCVRPLTACDHGLVDDVEHFPGFVRLVPPGDADHAIDHHEHDSRFREREEGLT